MDEILTIYIHNIVNQKQIKNIKKTKSKMKIKIKNKIKNIKKTKSKMKIKIETEIYVVKLINKNLISLFKNTDLCIFKCEY